MLSPKFYAAALLCAVLFCARNSFAVTLTSSQKDYTTSSDITTSGIGISSTLVGINSSPNKIKNTFIITTGNFGATSGAYGIKVFGNYNQVTNDVGAKIFTTGNSGRGISIANLSTVTNSGQISTQGTSSYAIYAGGNNNSITNSGAISTANDNSYGIYIVGNNNQASSSGSVSTAKDYGVYLNGDANQFSNSGAITANGQTSSHGIYVSAGSDSTASESNYSTVANSGTINATGNGIYAKDNFVRINNSGAINAGASSSLYAIRSDGDNATITNSGAISASKYAIYNSGENVVINNSGNLTGGIRVGSGLLNILGGSISGDVDGNSGVGSVNVGAALSAINFDLRNNFNGLDALTIKAGSTLNSYGSIKANAIFLEANSTLSLKSGSSTNVAIVGSNDNFGNLEIDGIKFESGQKIGDFGASLKNLNIASNSSLSASRDIHAQKISLAGELNFFGANDLTIYGSLEGSGSARVNVESNAQNVSGNFTLVAGDIFAIAMNKNGVGNLAAGGLVNVDQNVKLELTTTGNQNYIADGQEFQILTGADGSSLHAISKNHINVNNRGTNSSGLIEFSTVVEGNSMLLKATRSAPSGVIKNGNSQKIYQSINQVGAQAQGKMRELQLYLDSGNLSDDAIAKTINQIAPQPSKASLGTSNNIAISSLKVAEIRLDKIRAGLGNAPARGSDFKFLEKVFSPKRGQQFDIFNLQQEGGMLQNGVWIQPFGGSATQDVVGDDDGYKAIFSGVAFGIDREISNETAIGAAFSYARSETKSFDSSKKNAISAYQLNFYGSKNFSKNFIDSLLGISWNQYSSSRAIAAVSANASANYNGKNYVAKLKAGRVEKISNKLAFIPEISASFSHNQVDGYSEKGADSLNLRVGAVSSNFLEARIGGNLRHIDKCDEFPEFEKFVSLLKISYGYSLINSRPNTVASFSDQNSSFNSQVTNVDRASAKLGFEISGYRPDDVILSIDYQLEKRATYQSHFVAFKALQKF